MKGEEGLGLGGYSEVPCPGGGGEARGRDPRSEVQCINATQDPLP